MIFLDVRVEKIYETNVLDPEKFSEQIEDYFNM
jgi:hypothetical protein